MENRHYLGDDFYPAIIDQETFDKAAEDRIRTRRETRQAEQQKECKTGRVSYRLRMAAAEQHYEDPRLQAEYLYSLIESEVS
jgi:hypothetical protein